MSNNISVPWECVTDGRTRQGANLKHHLEALLNSGFRLDVETPEGERTFELASEIHGLVRQTR